MAGTAQDVTELRGAESARREAEAKLHEIDRLETLDKFKTQFMNTAAHELGTPLTPILLQIHMLRKRLHGPEEEASLAVLERNINRLRTLVGDLLDGSRLQAGRMVLKPTRVDLAVLARDAVRAYEEPARDAGVTLDFRAEPSLWADVDPERIGQVIDNLLSNAIKFTPPGGRIEVTGQHGGDGIVLRVRDTGVGIQDADLDKIFQPFSRIETHGEHVREGTGLGLYLSKGLIELHGGAIGVDSLGPGQGSTFSFVLPAAPS
jgi:signal transduction histidine kinase